MASGLHHDRATWLLALPFGLLWWPWQGRTGFLVAAAAFLLGGLWLSPDLDTRSNPSRRWGPLRLLWWPYRRLLKHRSLISHSPVLGSTVRLLYLAGIVGLLCGIAHPWGAPSPQQLAEQLELGWQQHRGLSLAALAGIEASAWLHLVLDGDPMPRWRRKRSKLRQRR
jgi:uncharacterized metal-binding protein